MRYRLITFFALTVTVCLQADNEKPELSTPDFINELIEIELPQTLEILENCKECMQESDYEDIKAILTEYQDVVDNDDENLKEELFRRHIKILRSLIVRGLLTTRDLRVENNALVRGDLTILGNFLNGGVPYQGPQGPQGPTGAAGSSAIPASAEWGTLDAFARRQLWYYALMSILRFGSSTADGDATNVVSEGAVFYGKNTLGSAMGNNDFSYARIKSLRFALHNAITAFGQADIFRADETGVRARNDSNVITWEVNRARGTSRTAAGVTGSRPTAANVAEQWFDTTLGIPIWWDGSNWVDGSGAVV